MDLGFGFVFPLSLSSGVPEPESPVAFPPSLDEVTVEADSERLVQSYPSVPAAESVVSEPNTAEPSGVDDDHHNPENRYLQSRSASIFRDPGDHLAPKNLHNRLRSRSRERLWLREHRLKEESQTF